MGSGVVKRVDEFVSVFFEVKVVKALGFQFWKYEVRDSWQAELGSA